MRRGRDKALIDARDQRMFERYYYWTEVKRLRFDDAVKKLSKEEFFLSESRVLQILRDMIRAGATVDGKQIEKPLFTGFKLKPQRSATTLPPKRPRYVERSLFPDY